MKEGSTFALCLERNRAWNTEVMQWESGLADRQDEKHRQRGEEGGLSTASRHLRRAPGA